MKGHQKVWAGTALALLMAAVPLGGADALTLRATTEHAVPDMRLLHVQDEAAPEQPAGEEPPPRKKQREKKNAPAEQPAAERAQQAEPEAAPAEEQPREKRREKKQAPAEEPAQRAEPQPEPEAAPREEPPRKREKEQAPAEQPAEQAPAPEPEAEQPGAPAEKPASPARKPAPAAEQPEEPAPPAEAAPGAEQPRAQEPEAEQPAPEAKPGEKPPRAEKPRSEKPAAPAESAPEAEKPAEQPKTERPAAPDQTPPPAEQEAPATQQPEQSGEAPAGGEAPVLDSQKVPPRDGAPVDGEVKRPGEQPPAQPDEQAPAQTGEQQPGQPEQPPAEPGAETAQPAAPAEPAGPPPADDRAAQEGVAPVEVQPVTREEGKRVEREPDFRRQERPRGVDVLREIGDRVIIQLNDRRVVESDDRPRMSRGARDVYYEDLPRGRTRETIVRENGVQVITIRNRYGDIVRRSRIAPDGQEYVLTYVDENEYDQRDDWRDPGDDLPPMHLTIPVEEYILDSERVEDPNAYYEFLDQPPVEAVERLYSVDEVKRSARVRDKTRRIDLDTVTFEFGSASIVESEIPRLEGVAQAMEKLLKDNPAETFLIEGHTDAVGTDDANLALSDRRAEAVADAMSNVFGIPPENLTTQGYGEQYLKVNTEEPERENRRVAIRRITALVSPVASAN